MKDIIYREDLGSLFATLIGTVGDNGVTRDEISKITLNYFGIMSKTGNVLHFKDKLGLRTTWSIGKMTELNDDKKLQYHRSVVATQRDAAWRLDSMQNFLKNVVGKTGCREIIINRIYDPIRKCHIYRIIDGNNRRRTFYMFHQGHLAFPARTVVDNFYDVSGMTLKQILKEAWGKDFYERYCNIEFSVTVYEDLTPDEEMEVFNNSNTNTKLTKAENRNSITGPFRNMVQDIAKKHVSLFKKMGIKTYEEDFDQDSPESLSMKGRYAYLDHENIAKILIYFLHMMEGTAFSDGMVKDKELKHAYETYSTFQCDDVMKAYRKYADTLKIIDKCFGYLEDWRKANKVTKGRFKDFTCNHVLLIIHVLATMTGDKIETLKFKNPREFAYMIFDSLLALYDDTNSLYQVAASRHVNFSGTLNVHGDKMVKMKTHLVLEQLKNIDTDSYTMADKSRTTNKAIKEEIRHRCGDCCEKCETETEEKLAQYHHIDFYANGGLSNDPKNILRLCKSCHHEIHFAQYRNIGEK